LKGIVPVGWGSDEIISAKELLNKFPEKSIKMSEIYEENEAPSDVNLLPEE
jgi:hypothetical protein